MLTPTLPLTMLRDEIDTPLGRLVVLADEAGALHQVGWVDGHRRAPRRGLATDWIDPRQRISAARDPGGASSLLAAYFAGELSAIAGLAVARSAVCALKMQRALSGQHSARSVKPV